MDIEEIIETIGGTALYHATCQAARQAAGDPNYGGSGATPFNSKIPRQISNLIWDSDLSIGEKLRLTFFFYEAMPCYTYMMMLNMYYSDFTSEEKSLFWEWMRTQLQSKDEALAFPVAYALWCDFLEDPNTVTESWQALITPLPSDNALQKLLIYSGPVPFNLKIKLYETLLPNPLWHYYIFRSLLHSAFDVYGKIEPDTAKMTLRRLTLPQNTEHLDALKQRLGN